MHALLFLGLLLADDATKDAANIEGTWVVESATAEGKPEEDVQGDKLTFEKGMLTIKSKKENKKEEKGTYKLDPSTTPRSIDFQEQGKDKVMKGIYKLDGDKLTICVSPEAETKRPTEFSAKAGSAQMLLELKREKK